MHWFSEHPYRVGLIAAVAFVIIVGLITLDRSAVVPRGDIATWGGGALFEPVGYHSGARERPSYEDTSAYILAGQVGDTVPLSYLPLGTPAENSASGNLASDINMLLAELTEGFSVTQPNPSDTDGVYDAFSFIPRGLIATTTRGTKRTPLQERLYEYGNRVGAEIQAFESAWPNAIQILQEQADDRENEVKGAAVEEYARAFSALGVRIAGIGNIPEEAREIHRALARGYTSAGEKLALVPKARTDEEFLNAVLAYNATMDTFTESFVALALFFTAHGISFSQEDPGSVFSFKPISF